VYFRSEIKSITMTKHIITYLVFTISLSACAQNKTEEVIEEITRDSNGKIISTTIVKKDKGNVLSAEEVLNQFYNNQEKIEELDKCMSFRFYQKTPYSKFKEIMASKNKLCGKFITKKIIETEYSPDKKAVRYKIQVTYETKNTVEQIIMIKESEQSKFEIFEYVILENQ
jgi:hypothetical protein